MSFSEQLKVNSIVTEDSTTLKDVTITTLTMGGDLDMNGNDILNYSGGSGSSAMPYWYGTITSPLTNAGQTNLLLTETGSSGITAAGATYTTLTLPSGYIYELTIIARGSFTGSLSTPGTWIYTKNDSDSTITTQSQDSVTSLPISKTFTNSAFHEAGSSVTTATAIFAASSPGSGNTSAYSIFVKAISSL